MSRTVLVTGKINEVKPKNGATLQQVAEHLLTERGIKLASYYEDALEQLTDDLYEEYVVLNDKLYKISEYKQNDSGDIFQATKNRNGSISFLLQYYNGGCGFSEALEHAIKKLEK